MEKIKIIVGDDEFPVNYKLLQYLATRLPNEDNYRPLAKRLTEIGIPSINIALIQSGILENNDMDKLWIDGNINVRRALAWNENFVRKLTDEQSEEIIRENDQELWSGIAENAEDIYPEGYYAREQGTRLSQAMADNLFEAMLNSQYAEVRQKLRYKEYIPEKFKLPLIDQIKSGQYSYHAIVNGADESIVETLAHADFNYIDRFANYIQDIENENARIAIGNFLITHSDPYVRLELANNKHAPKEMLQKLLLDSDADVQECARKSLEEKDKDQFFND